MVNGGYVVGVDAGGTSTRALVLAADGSRVGAATAGGANPNSHPPQVAAGNVAAAVRAALDGVDPGQVRGGVLGMAGVSKLSDPAIAALFQAAWTDAGPTCPLRVVSDSEAAFAAGSAEPDGTVLVSGTGSIAARIRAHRTVATAGGYGWLLGDEGSAFWIGRQAVRATLDALRGGAPLDGLATAVLAEALDEDAGNTGDAEFSVRRLITAANAATPILLARFAPLVSAAQGEPTAEKIIDEAAELLVSTALAAREPGERSPIVLVGSVLTGSPVGERVHANLLGYSPRVHTVIDGAPGAAWLAAIDVFGPRAHHP